MDPKTVRAVLRRSGKRQLAPRRPSLLDPFRPLIRQLVLEKDLSAVLVLRRLRALEYRGSYTILKDFIRSFRPRAVTAPHLRFETRPGIQAQVDLSPYTVLLGGVRTPVVCFSLVLGYSRWQFIRFTLHADAHSVCHGHVLAFDKIGGVPHHILYDRMKQVVIYSGRDHVIFHSLFESLAQHYDFTPIPLEPGYKEGKGKVERPFQYVEGNFLPDRTFHDLADMNRQADAWRRDIAGERDHGTTHVPPNQRLDEERPFLRPLPTARFDAAIAVPRQVGDDFCVAWETNRYSVPPRFAGRDAWLRVLDGEIEIAVAGEVVARTYVRDTRHKRHVQPEHEAEFRAHSSSRLVLEEQFLRLGSAARDYLRGLREARGGAAGYHMSRILQLLERVGAEPIHAAIVHALKYEAFDAQVIVRIVAGKPTSIRPPTPAGSSFIPAHIAEYLQGAGSHQRLPDAYVTPQRQEEDDHVRGPRPPAPESPAPPPPPRRRQPR